MSVTAAPDPTGLRPVRTGRRPRAGAWPSRAAGLLFSVLLTFFGLLAITFVIGRVVPIDPVLAIVGDRALPQVYARVRQELALDEPIYVQFWIYLSHVLRGDFGTSVLTSRPVLEDILHFFPATIELATLATLIGVLAGVPMGVIGATHHGRWPDHLIRVVGLIGYSVPVFWLGLVGLLILYARLDLVAPQMDEGIAIAKDAAERGFLMPTFITKSSLGQLEQFLGGAPAKNVLVASLDERAAKIAELPAADRSAFVAAAEKTVASSVIPAFTRVQALLRAQLPRTSDNAGLVWLSGGDKAYANALRRFTTIPGEAVEKIVSQHRRRRQVTVGV